MLRLVPATHLDLGAPEPERTQSQSGVGCTVIRYHVTFRQMWKLTDSDPAQMHQLSPAPAYTSGK